MKQSRMLSLLAMLLLLGACAHSGQAPMTEHPAWESDPRERVANEFYRCQPGSGIRRFTPSGGVPDHRQVPRGGNCLR